MKLFYAKILSKELVKLLGKYCTRIEVAGSIRRECDEVSDIDIVLIPHAYNLEQYLMFNALKDGIETPKNSYSKLKWGPKYKQIRYKGHKMELWIADKFNWGLIFAIRTGSANFSKQLLSNWKKVSKGGYSHNGTLRYKDGVKVVVYEETMLFHLCGMEYIEPTNRI